MHWYVIPQNSDSDNDRTIDGSESNVYPRASVNIDGEVINDYGTTSGLRVIFL